jgi:hypothetical protein
VQMLCTTAKKKLDQPIHLERTNDRVVSVAAGVAGKSADSTLG